MEIVVYNWEKFDKTRVWYIIFWIFFSFMIVISALVKNFMWVIVLFMLVGWYLVFSIIITKKILIKITDEWLVIDTRLYPYSEIWWYVLEVNEKQKKLVNIVFIIKNQTHIHTFADSPENIKEFIMQFDKIVTRFSSFEQPFIERLSRKLKL